MELPLAMPMQHVPGQDGTALQQSENYTIGQLYTFQTHKIDWKACLVVRLTLGALAGLPRHWNLLPSLHLAAYVLTHDEPSASTSSDPTSLRRDLFSCCVQDWRQGQTTTKSPVVRLSRPSNDHSLPFAMGSPIARYSTRPHRRGGVPRAHAEACRQIAEDARALQKVRFSLNVWVESVDRVAGRRKVGYLFTVRDTTLLSRRTVMRSAVTIKNAVLLLRLEHQLDREEVASERGTTRVDETQGNDGMEWQHLCVESREY